ncbi:hypothetical protein RSSM_01059 [Rhodopirellula sallentina SM41]|uniref:Uncharacterized protein n=1 Tax=Rhodopirellula sallentina SM41 TaxID=1263870 RepID=M5U7U4_9BACT|nr:hypothetical protein RSSM_01059 [Rhodopirellula sallentina SM41]
MGTVWNKNALQELLPTFAFRHATMNARMRMRGSVSRKATTRGARPDTSAALTMALKIVD